MTAIVQTTHNGYCRRDIITLQAKMHACSAAGGVDGDRRGDGFRTERTSCFRTVDPVEGRTLTEAGCSPCLDKPMNTSNVIFRYETKVEMGINLRSRKISI